MKFNILKKFEKKLYFSYPFPHFIIPNALENEEYSLLEKEFYIIENYFKRSVKFKNNNIRLQFNQLDLDKINLDIPNWKEFLVYHSSDLHFKNMYKIFEDDLKKIYSKLSEEILEKSNDFKHFCQPSINTPVKRYTTVLTPHLDRNDTLFTGLFYLRDKNDQTHGGDFEIYESKKKNYFYRKAEVSNLNSIKLHKTIKYERNTFIGLLNTKISIHSVSKREKTEVSRKFVNFITKVPQSISPLYSIDKDINYARVLKNKIKDLFILGS